MTRCPSRNTSYHRYIFSWQWLTLTQQEWLMAFYSCDFWHPTLSKWNKRVLVAPAFNRSESFSLLLATGDVLFQQELLHNFLIPQFWERYTCVGTSSVKHSFRSTHCNTVHNHKATQGGCCTTPVSRHKLCWVFVPCSGSKSLQSDMTLQAASCEQHKKLVLKSFLATNFYHGRQQLRLCYKEDTCR